MLNFSDPKDISFVGVFVLFEWYFSKIIGILAKEMKTKGKKYATFLTISKSLNLAEIFHD
jgi:hypothetical protein